MKVKYFNEKALDSKGFFVIEHVPTGRMYADTALNMGKEIDRIFKWLDTEDNDKSFRTQTFRKLHRAEPHYQVHLHDVDRIDDAKKNIKAFLAQKPTYLLL